MTNEYRGNRGKMRIVSLPVNPSPQSPREPSIPPIPHTQDALLAIVAIILASRVPEDAREQPEEGCRPRSDRDAHGDEWSK